jgi:hypothetical protein
MNVLSRKEEKHAMIVPENAAAELHRFDSKFTRVRLQVF